MTILIILDLDQTVFNFYAHNAYASVQSFPPFTKVNKDTLKTSNGQQFQLFPGARKVIEFLLAKPNEYIVRIASASRATSCAKEMLLLFGFPARLLKGAQIFSGDKTKHLTTIGLETQISLNSRCIFFDDLTVFCNQAEKIGVTAVKVDPSVGITLELLSHGLSKLKTKNKSSNFMSQWASKVINVKKRKTTTTTKTLTSKSSKIRSNKQSRFTACPVCLKSFPTSRIQNHVIKCLEIMDILL